MINGLTTYEDGRAKDVINTCATADFSGGFIEPGEYLTIGMYVIADNGDHFGGDISTV